MGVDKEGLSNSCTKTLKDSKVSFQVDQFSKPNYFLSVSSNAVYDIPFCSYESLILFNVKKKIFKCCYIRPNPGGESHMLSTCWLLFLHSAAQLIPNHLNWVEVWWFWRPGHLMQHSITLLLGQIHSLEVCFGSLSCWETNDSPTKCKPDGMTYHFRMLW